MKKLNQRYINKIIFSKLFENTSEPPPAPEYVLPSGWDPNYDPSIEDWERPDIDRETANDEEMNQNFKFLEYYYKFLEWYKKEYPGDSDDRLQNAWEFMQKEIQRLIRKI